MRRMPDCKLQSEQTPNIYSSDTSGSTLDFHTVYSNCRTVAVQYLKKNILIESKTLSTASTEILLQQQTHFQLGSVKVTIGN